MVARLMLVFFIRKDAPRRESMMSDGASIDPGEWDAAADELDDLLHAYCVPASPDCRSAIVKWHLEALAVARDVWTPGLGLTSDAVVEKVLSRFHSHRIRTTIAQMAVENSEMASRLARALECLKFYAARRADAGAYARSILAALNLPPRRVDSPDQVPDRFLVRKRGG